VTTAGRRAGDLRRRTSSAITARFVVRPFHRLFYNSGKQTWSDTHWLGVPTQKCAFDLWVYQEILHELRPEVIVECGTANGGSALFLASIFDLLGQGEVITVDIVDQPGRPSHERITYVTGSSTDLEIVEQVERLVGSRAPVVVILDSDHSRDHVLNELRLYAPLVSAGSYVIVEDSNVNGHPVVPDFGPGPAEAVARFLAETSEFEVDRSREKFFLTFNPCGYLRKLPQKQPPGQT
jgi:cephalosporin hydroxylase